jgi:Fe-S-cluster-containing dehydrogenase component
VKKYVLHLNTRRCIGCHGCEVHCKTNKDLPVGPILCEISHTPLQKIAGVPRTEFSFKTCNHCLEPLCVPVCPTGAMIRRDDSIVYINAETCIGCMACRTACPWHIPEYNPVTAKAVKCDMCMDRLDLGLKPACVAKCTTHALQLMTLQTV